MSTSNKTLEPCGCELSLRCDKHLKALNKMANDKDIKLELIEAVEDYLKDIRRTMGSCTIEYLQTLVIRAKASL